MRTRVSRRLALASAAVLLVSAVAVPSAMAITDYEDFTTDCSVSGSGWITLTSTVDIPADGYYYYAWRTDDGSSSRTIASRVRYLRAGAADTVLSTRTRITDDNYIFGITRISNGDYAYVNCGGA